jgi:hypothetical protein
LVARAACHGSLPAPSGSVPGDDEVVPEQADGPDCVSESKFEVLPAIDKGRACNLFYVLGPDVSRFVLPVLY